MATEKERKTMVHKIRKAVKYVNYLTSQALRLDLLTSTHVDNDGDLIIDRIIRNYHEEE